MALFSDAYNIAVWAGWERSEANAFFAHLGFGTGLVVHPRLLCMLSEENLADTLKSWMVEGEPAKPALKMVATLVHKTCFFVLGKLLPSAAPLVPPSPSIEKKVSSKGRKLKV